MERPPNAGLPASPPQAGLVPSLPVTTQCFPAPALGTHLCRSMHVGTTKSDSKSQAHQGSLSCLSLS